MVFLSPGDAASSPYLRRLYEDPNSSLDPATGQPLFVPFTNHTRRSNKKRQRRRPRSTGHGVDHDGPRHRGWRRFALGRERVSLSRGRRGSEVDECEEDEDDELERQEGLETIHSRLWERGLDLQRRREAGARFREDERRAKASQGHVNGR